MSFLHFSENSTVGHLLRMQRDLTFNKLGVIIISKTACSNEIRDLNPLQSVRTVCASPRCTTGLVHLRIWPVKPCYVFLRSKLCQNLCVWLIFHWWHCLCVFFFFTISTWDRNANYFCNLGAKSDSYFRPFLFPPWTVTGCVIYFPICHELFVFITDEIWLAKI